MTHVELRHASTSRRSAMPLQGYVVRPQGDGPWPGVVLIHEIFGIDDVMLRQAQRMADAGYLTLAIDLYSSGGAMRCLVPTMRSLFSGSGRAYTDIETGRQWLADHEDCTGKVGVVGFCMGGGFALVTASTFDAAGVNYGQLPKDHERALATACPIVASYGSRDLSLRGAAAKLEAALSLAGISHDVKQYPDAGHSFMNDAPVGPRLMRPLLKVTGMGPDPAAAADAWGRIARFFDEHLT